MALMTEGNGDLVMAEMHNEPGGEMQELINEMDELNSWYNDEVSKRCRSEDMECGTCLSCLFNRDALMTSWIGDLTEQNELIFNIIKETQIEGDKVIQNLERKLLDTKLNAGRENMEKEKSRIHLDNLLYEKNSLEKQYNKIQDLKKTYDLKRNQANENLQLAEKQLHSLLELANRLESQGSWDIRDLQLDNDSYELLFGEDPTIIGGPCKAIVDYCRRNVKDVFEKETLRMDIRLLNDSIKTKNKEIDKLKSKLTSVSENSLTSYESYDSLFKVEKSPKDVGKAIQTSVTLMNEINDSDNSKINAFWTL